jgi:hypothetical protein
MLSFVAHAVPFGALQAKTPSANKFKRFLNRFASEWITASEHNVQDDADSPFVDDWAVRLFAEDFWTVGGY